MIENSNRTNIELIIALANYAKHKDEGDPHPGTSAVLDTFNFKYKDLIYLDEGPIFCGPGYFKPGLRLVQNPGGGD